MSEKEIALTLAALLKTAPDVTAEVGARFYANWSPAEVALPFMTYTIQDSEKLTKDGGTRWPVALHLVYKAEGYAAALDFEEKILVLLQDTDFEVLPSENRPDPETDRFVRVINLQIINY